MLSPIDKLKDMPFKAYLVGGCVRDMVLKREPKDFDYVVVGESPASMIAFGAKEVGAAFPVFLFGDNESEFALARLEKSTGPGYADFEFVWDNVTLEQDLFRRDLTINAMALDSNGQLFDPHGGREDIRNRVIRHVSNHFVEDPLRIFRAARFAAQLNFDIAPETMELMKEMVSLKMVDAMTKERMTGELIKALMSPHPRRFFEVLDETGALKDWLPVLSDMHGVPQRRKFHAEGCVWTHNMMVLDQAALATVDHPTDSKLRIRLACLFHDVGKTRTPHELLYNPDGSELGKHIGHDNPKLMDEMFGALKEVLKGLDSSVLLFAKQVAINHQSLHRLLDKDGPKGAGLVRLYERCGGRRAFEKEGYLDDLTLACQSDHFGRMRLDEEGMVVAPGPYPEAKAFKVAMETIHGVEEGPIIGPMIKAGKGIEKAKEALHRARLVALAQQKDRTAQDPTMGM